MMVFKHFIQFILKSEFNNLHKPQAAPRSAGPSGLSGFVPSTDNIARAQKLSKFAVSSLDYEDIPSAIDNLEKALRLLKTGSEN